MSIGEILITALVDTVLGMGTVFCILIFISFCIWILGRLCAPKQPAAAAAAAAPEPAAELEDDGISPELVAVITAAVHQYIADQRGADESGDFDSGDYIVRNVRRATWRHI